MVVKVSYLFVDYIKRPRGAGGKGAWVSARRSAAGAPAPCGSQGGRCRAGCALGYRWSARACLPPPPPRPPPQKNLPAPLESHDDLRVPPGRVGPLRGVGQAVAGERPARRAVEREEARKQAAPKARLNQQASRAPPRPMHARPAPGGGAHHWLHPLSVLAVLIWKCALDRNDWRRWAGGCGVQGVRGGGACCCCALGPRPLRFLPPRPRAAPHARAHLAQEGGALGDVIGVQPVHLDAVAPGGRGEGQGGVRCVTGLSSERVSRKEQGRGLAGKAPARPPRRRCSRAAPPAHHELTPTLHSATVVSVIRRNPSPAPAASRVARAEPT